MHLLHLLVLLLLGDPLRRTRLIEEAGLSDERLMRLWHLLLHYRRRGLLLELALTAICSSRVLRLVLVLHAWGEHVWIWAHDRALVAWLRVLLVLHGCLLRLLLLLGYMMMELELLLHIVEGLLGGVGEGDTRWCGRDMLLQLLLDSVLLLLCRWHEGILIIIICIVLCNELLETKHVLCWQTFLYRVEQVRWNYLQRWRGSKWASSYKRQSLRGRKTGNSELAFLCGAVLKVMLISLCHRHNQWTGCIELLMILQLRLLHAIHHLLGLLFAAEYIEVKPLLVDLLRCWCAQAKQRSLWGKRLQWFWRRIKIIYRLFVIDFKRRKWT